jgi:hypothetical protein
MMAFLFAVAAVIVLASLFGAFLDLIEAADQPDHGFEDVKAASAPDAERIAALIKARRDVAL